MNKFETYLIELDSLKKVLDEKSSDSIVFDDIITYILDVNNEKIHISIPKKFDENTYFIAVVKLNSQYGISKFILDNLDSLKKVDTDLYNIQEEGIFSAVTYKSKRLINVISTPERKVINFRYDHISELYDFLLQEIFEVAKFYKNVKFYYGQKALDFGVIVNKKVVSDDMTIIYKHISTKLNKKLTGDKYFRGYNFVKFIKRDNSV